MRTWQVIAALGPAFLGRDGARLRAAFLALGGIFPKLGQQISVRYDIWPRWMCDALTPLQGDRGRGSIGYVRRVGKFAVKHILPGRREEILRDLEWYRRVARALRFVPGARRLKLHESYHELSCMFNELIDLNYEGAYTRKMRKQLKPLGIRVPRVYSCTADRLVTEWIDGVTMTEVLKDPDAFGRRRGKKHARRALNAVLRSIVEVNLFHLDLHPGNMIVTLKNKLAWIDCTPGVTEGDFLRHFQRFIEALAARDWKWAAQMFCYMQRGVVGTSPLARLFGQRRLARTTVRLIEVLSAWGMKTCVGGLAYAERSLNTLTQRMMLVVVRAGAQLNPMWLRLQQCLTTLERLIEVFWSDVDYLRVAKRYVKAHRRRNPQRIFEQAREVLDMVHQRLDQLTTRGLINLMFEGA